MSDNIMSFNFLKEKFDITYSQYIDMIKEADRKDETKDGNVSANIFEEVLKEYCSENNLNYAQIEDDYANAFNALASLDEDAGSVSYSDIVTNSQTSAIELAQTANSENNWANSEEYKNRENKTPVAIENVGGTQGVKPKSVDDLMGQDIDSLREERSRVFKDIDTLRNAIQKETAAAQAAYDEAQVGYQEALDAVSMAVEDDQSQVAEDYKNLKAEKDANTQNIDNQRGVISDLSSSSDNQRIVIASTQEQIDVLSSQEPNKADYTKQVTETVKDEDGNETEVTKEVEDLAAFTDAYKRWNEQKEQLEQQKIEAEKQLSLYEQQLGEAQDALNILEEEQIALDEQLANKTEELAQTNEIVAKLKDDVEIRKNAVDEAKAELESNNTINRYEASLAQHQQNLAVYDEAISIAQNSTNNVETQNDAKKEDEFANKELDALKTGDFSENAFVLEDISEQEKYLKEYIGDGKFGEIAQEGNNYFTKNNEDGSQDCFKVVDDNGEIKIVHTYIPPQGNSADPTTEVFGVNTLTKNIISGVESKQGQDYASRLETIQNAKSADGASGYNPISDYQDVINDIISDTSLPPIEALALLDEINTTGGGSVNTRSTEFIELMKRAYEEGDLDTALTFAHLFNSSDTAIKDKKTFTQTRTAPDGTSLTYTDSFAQAEYIHFVKELYENAQSQEEIQKINETFPDLASVLQARYSFEAETKELNELFTSFVGADTEKYAASDDQILKWNNYGTPSSTTFAKILEDKDAFADPDNFIKALMWASNGDVDLFTEHFRNLWWFEQENYLPSIIQAFGGSWEE